MFKTEVKEGRKMQQRHEKNWVKHKTNLPFSLSTDLWFIRTVHYKIILIQESITSPNILKITPLAPSSFLFLPSPTHTSHRLWTCYCSCVGEWGLSACLSLSCFDCLSTAPRLCSIFGTQTLKWNGMPGNPGCLYNKEHVASLGNNETRWMSYSSVCHTSSTG